MPKRQQSRRSATGILWRLTLSATIDCRANVPITFNGWPAVGKKTYTIKATTPDSHVFIVTSPNLTQAAMMMEKKLGLAPDR